MDLQGGQIQSLGEILRVVWFQQESVTTWMMLNPNHQSGIAYTGKRGTPDKDA